MQRKENSHVKTSLTISFAEEKDLRTEDCILRRKIYRTESKSQSEFIDRAIRYFVGHVTVEEDAANLPNAFLSNNRKRVAAESDNCQSRIAVRAWQLRLLSCKIYCYS